MTGFVAFTLRSIFGSTVDTLPAAKFGTRGAPMFKLKWIFVLETDYAVNAKRYHPNDFTVGRAYEDRSGQRRLEIYPDGTVKVLARYSWDGCTPKFAL